VKVRGLAARGTDSYNPQCNSGYRPESAVTWRMKISIRETRVMLPVEPTLSTVNTYKEIKFIFEIILTLSLPN
jgi:hypothetical protein